MMRRLAVLALAAFTSACFDFVEPDLADESGGALLQVTATQVENGIIDIDALFAPGIDADGFRRRVDNDTLRVLGLALGPVSQRASGTRVYDVNDTIAGLTTLHPFTVVAPRVEGVAPLPEVVWQGFRKLGSDTVIIQRGDELTLPVETDLGVPRPTKPNQQWLLGVAGKTNSFLIGGSGLPPLVIRIPVAWIPERPDSILSATLTVSQSGVVRVPAYRAALNYSASINWTVIIR